MESQAGKFFVMRRPDSEAVVRFCPQKYDERFAGARYLDSVPLGTPYQRLAMYREYGTIREGPAPILEARFEREEEKCTETTAETRIGDAVWCMSHLLINDRFLSVLDGANVIGFNTIPVTLETMSYHLVVPTGWGGLASAKAKLLRTTVGKYNVHVRYQPRAHPEELIDLERWDGSDIFIVWPMGNALFVTERIKNLIEDAQLTGVICVPELAIIRRSEQYGGGQLSSFMPLEVAMKRGLEYGIEEV